MDSLVITGNKNKLAALDMVNELYDAYDGKSEVTEFVIKVFYSHGKPRSVSIAFSGEDKLDVKGGKTDA